MDEVRYEGQVVANGAILKKIPGCYTLLGARTVARRAAKAFTRARGAAPLRVRVIKVQGDDRSVEEDIPA